MAEGKRYYWLKLYDDFFGSMRIKKLRKLAGGDTYLIIYLKLQLKAMKTDGIIKYTGLEQNIAEEIALDIDEQPDDVKVTLSFLVGCGLAETNAESSYMFLPYAVKNTGSEGSDAQRIRDFRAKKKLPAPEAVTDSEQCTNSVRTMYEHRNGEKEKEKEKETRDRDKSKRKKQDSAEAVVDLIRAYTENEQLQDALVAYLQFRKDIKKPMSAGAVKLLTGKLDKLAETDDDRIEILNNSIVNGWTGIYAMKGDKDKDGKIHERRGTAKGKYEPIGSGETIV